MQRPSARPTFREVESELTLAVHSATAAAQRSPTQMTIFLSYRVQADADLVERIFDKMRAAKIVAKRSPDRGVYRQSF